MNKRILMYVPLGAIVFVGSSICADLFHTVAHTELECTLPPGYSLNSAVIVIQNGGSVASSPNLSYTQCSAGEYQEAGVSSCSACEPGTYTSLEGSALCLDCALGKFANSSGASECMECGPGKYQSEEGKSHCLECQQGTFTSTSTTKYACIECDAGRYQNATGQEECIACPVGKYQDKRGQVNCTQCPMGQISAGTSIHDPCCMVAVTGIALFCV